MSAPDLIHRIESYNKGRAPEYLARKYAAMSSSAFSFFRGTAHLFFEDIPKESFLLQSPKTWICGDLHVENLGSFKGDNGLAYFDMNDFDEAALAPCLLDVARFACSVHMGAEELGLNARKTAGGVNVFLDNYIAALQKGYIRSLEKGTAAGVVKIFLEQVQTRTRKEFLAGRVVEKKGKPRLDTSSGRFVAIAPERAKEVSDAFRKTTLFKADPDYFAIHDVAFRIAGTGSLGLERYALLVEGKPGKSRYALIDIKEAQAPSMLMHHPFRQPKWPNQAERIVEIQQRVEAAAPALLSTVEIKGKHFVVKELQPLEDKLALEHLKGRVKRCTIFTGTVGELAAWGALRSGGRQGSATADELIGFGSRAKEWKKDVAAYAASYAVTARKDFVQFRNARGIKAAKASSGVKKS